MVPHPTQATAECSAECRQVCRYALKLTRLDPVVQSLRVLTSGFDQMLVLDANASCHQHLADVQRDIWYGKVLDTVFGQWSCRYR